MGKIKVLGEIIIFWEEKRWFFNTFFFFLREEMFGVIIFYEIELGFYWEMVNFWIGVGRVKDEFWVFFLS